MERGNNLGIRENGSDLGTPEDMAQRARAEALIAAIHRLETEHAIHLVRQGDMISQVLVNENGYRQLVREGIEVKPLQEAPKEPYSPYKYQVNQRSLYDKDGNRCATSLNGVLTRVQLQEAFEPTLARMAQEEREQVQSERAEAGLDDGSASGRNRPWLEAAKNGITYPKPPVKWADTMGGLDAAKGWGPEVQGR